MLFSLFCLFVVLQASAEIRIVAVKGDVQVRRGMGEQWVKAERGDILKPEDSMKSGKKSTAVITVDGKNKISVPELVIIDCSDLRTLTQEQLLLMLAMEKVRSVPADRREYEMFIPKTTTVHGENRGAVDSRSQGKSTAGVLQLNGTKVLYKQGYYATCVLKTKEVFRLNPELLNKFDARLTVANALEQMHLQGEALGEYLALKKAQLTPQQYSLVEQKIGELRRKAKG